VGKRDVGKREKKRKLWHESPYDGVPGFFPALLRLLYQFQGASQLGDPNEPAYVAPADPKCPLCTQSMAEHHFDRDPGKRTLMRCPKP